ncbi:DNA polymerase IV [Sedimentisphaera cyanobacteriorum]|uniref:DNA polymerase IV n=1 Tax=Sedimentisphaera cyanobacteriorum TaxID=1940790 RepID=A0A1Q2HMB5_9BACT|nr:Y-family DNA polymerase [Sedimentisphaera cyanobacteriorum]AQQ08669.1 DNA polymerase IV [Sedimentisphaera cyanobacteriorum]
MGSGNQRNTQALGSYFAIIDCNNFYVSCERVFRPDMRKRPVVVLSNNDGCIVARSNEAKSLGIAMGTPYFKAKKLLRENNAGVFSSNYTLYADMSERVMEIIEMFSPECEVYSIDEAFVSLRRLQEQPEVWAGKLRKTILSWTGIPVSIGIAETKTLAKIAGRTAKKSSEGVFILPEESDKRKQILEGVMIDDIWGVGRRLGLKLRNIGAENARQLSRIKPETARRRFSVNMERTVRELRGEPCFSLELAPPAKKAITVSRTFGRPVSSLKELKEAVSFYAVRACEKLRDQQSRAVVLTVFANTNRFSGNAYFGKEVRILPSPTFETSEIIREAEICAEKIFRQEKRFVKAGVILSGLMPLNCSGPGLFDTSSKRKKEKLMETIDKINQINDAGITWAAAGIKKPWKTAANRKSPRYTTCWKELPQAKA